MEDDGGAVHRCLHAIMHLIEDHAGEAEIPVRFAAAKLAEGDELILEKLNLDQNEKEMLEHIVKQMETERGLDRSAAIAHMRFDFIEKVCDDSVVKPKESKEHIRSTKIDRSLLENIRRSHVLSVLWLLFLSDIRGDRGVSCQHPGYGDHCFRRLCGSAYDCCPCK